METFFLIIKTLFVFLVILGLGNIGFEPMSGGGDFAPSEKVQPGNPDEYLRIEAVDTGIDTFNPDKLLGGYRYGPSMILNKDGSIDLWSAANGPGDITDMVTYTRLFNEGAKRTKEVVALKPTSETEDAKWTCDPGVIKFGGYYYIGYTSTIDGRGTDNSVYIARSKNPEGPFTEKWTGNGWGVSPVVPIIKYTGNPDHFGSGEPSFVLMGDKLFIYYSWCDEGATTRVATADATDENWPATIEYHGECIPVKNGGDSADVKYADEFGRFLAIFTEKRFSDDSYVAVWESFDGINFRQSGLVKTNTARKLHNCGISGRADGHIGKGDPVYLSYAYGSDWGNWPTRFHKVTLSLSSTAETDDGALENIEMPVIRRAPRAIPEIIMIKAEKQVYHIEQSENILIMAMDSDGFVFPVLTGAEFEGYDESVIKIYGGKIHRTGSGSTRVFVHWHGLSGEFSVYAGQ